MFPESCSIGSASKVVLSANRWEEGGPPPLAKFPVAILL